MNCSAFAKIDPGTCQICELDMAEDESEQHFDVEGKPCGWAHSDCAEAKRIKEGS